MAKDIIDYMILEGEAEGLEKSVHENLKEGWELYGPPFPTGQFMETFGNTSGVILCQAVVIRCDEDADD